MPCTRTVVVHDAALFWHHEYFFFGKSIAPMFDAHTTRAPASRTTVYRTCLCKTLQRLRANSLSPACKHVTHPDTEDPAIRGRRNREAERRKRSAKLKSAAAAAGAGAGAGAGASLDAECSIQGLKKWVVYAAAYGARAPFLLIVSIVYAAAEGARVPFFNMNRVYHRRGGTSTFYW